jgi:hypothetical protein
MPTPEAAFSASLRKQFKLAGYTVTQVIDAGVPGPSDLIVEWPGHFVWIELKVRAPLRAEQRQFLKRHWDFYRNAFLLRKSRKHGYTLWPGDCPLEEGCHIWQSPTLDLCGLIAAIEDCAI